MKHMVNAGIASHIGHYSDGVEVLDGRRWLYVSGTPGLDAATGALPDEFQEQAELAWKNVEAILAGAGMRIEDVVKLTQYLVRRDDLEAYRPIRARHLGDHRPASMLAFLRELVWPKMLIELEVVAAR